MKVVIEMRGTNAQENERLLALIDEKFGVDYVALNYPDSKVLCPVTSLGDFSDLFKLDKLISKAGYTESGYSYFVSKSKTVKYPTLFIAHNS